MPIRYLKTIKKRFRKEQQKLYEKVGQLQVEVDFKESLVVKKSSAECGALADKNLS